MELEKFEEKVCNTTGLDRGAHTHYSTEAESSSGSRSTPFSRGLDDTKLLRLGS